MLRELQDMLDEDQPFAFLDFAAKTLTEIEFHLGDYLATLRRSGIYEVAMFATAIDLLAHGVRPDSVLDPDTPPWLGQLNQGRFVQAKVCQESPETTSYLIEMTLAGGHVGCLQARINHARNDSLTNYFVTDDSAEAMGGILVAVTRPRGPEFTRFDPETAIDVVTRGIERYDAQPSEQEPANPWPRNRPLLDFALSHFVVVET